MNNITQIPTYIIRDAVKPKYLMELQTLDKLMIELDYTFYNNLIQVKQEAITDALMNNQMVRGMFSDVSFNRLEQVITDELEAITLQSDLIIK